jgi:tetratricopeptide (TPR) repeat protein
MANLQHSKILNTVARKVLNPVGVKQKGRSQIWLDDQGWWVTVIEFQSSSWSKGSYLNVGVNWQWYPNDYFSFDLGYREETYIEYKSDEQFEPEAHKLAQTALKKVEEYREALGNLESAKHYLLRSIKGQRLTFWGEFHCGMMCAIAGDAEKALSYLEQVINYEEDREWAIRLQKFALDISTQIREGSEIVLKVCDTIAETRRLKKLDKWQCVFR